MFITLIEKSHLLFSAEGFLSYYYTSIAQLKGKLFVLWHFLHSEIKSSVLSQTCRPLEAHILESVFSGHSAHCSWFFSIVPCYQLKLLYAGSGPSYFNLFLLTLIWKLLCRSKCIFLCSITFLTGNKYDGTGCDEIGKWQCNCNVISFSLCFPCLCMHNLIIYNIMKSLKCCFISKHILVSVFQYLKVLTKKVCMPIMLILGPNSRWKEVEGYLLIRVPASMYLRCCTGHFRVCTQTCIGYTCVWSGRRKLTIYLYDFIFFVVFVVVVVSCCLKYCTMIISVLYQVHLPDL